MSNEQLTINNKAVPELRFPEFQKNWSIVELSNLLSFKNGINASKDSYGSGYKFINVLDIIQNDYILHSNVLGKVNINEEEFKKNIVEYGDILFQRSSETREEVGQANVYLDKELPATFGGFVIRGKAKKEYDSQFMNALLKTSKARKEITRKSGGSTRYNVGQDTLSKVKIFTTEIKEQQKIANFLTAVDQRIGLLKQKKAALQTYKKGLMQKIFNQEVRFKDKNGKNYPDWEEKRLGEISDTPEYGMNAASTKFNGIDKYIRITDIDENNRQFDSSNLVSPKGGGKFKYKLIEGDILFARTGASVGKSYIYSKDDGDVYFAGFLIRFRMNQFVVPTFIFLQSLTYRFQKWVKVMSMRSGQPGINANEYASFKIQLPCKEEQQKIAECLSEIDQSINQLSKQINQTTQFKKGLLQRMFV